MGFKIAKYGAIDIGSNGVRLLIMNIYSDPIKTVFNKTLLVRTPVRLGTDSFTKGYISEETIDLLAKSMISFRNLLESYKVKEYIACATSALREAKNADEVVDYIYRKSGVKIKPISGKVEADILFQTQLRSELNENNNYLLIDVGGGSTEISYLKGSSKISSKSIKIGTVRLKEGLVSEDIWVELKDYINKLNINENCVVLGTGGNINTLFKLKSEHRIDNDKSYLSLRYINNFNDEIKKMTHEEILMKYNFKPDRADVISYALDIYIMVLETSGIDRIIVPKMGLADGLIKLQHHDSINKIESEKNI